MHRPAVRIITDPGVEPKASHNLGPSAHPLSKKSEGGAGGGHGHRGPGEGTHRRSNNLALQNGTSAKKVW